MPVLVDERMDLVYLRMKTALMLVDPKNYLPINVDISKAVGIVIGNLPEIRPLFPQLFELKGFDRKAAEEIEDRAKVLLYLHAQCASPSLDPNELNALNTEARKLLVVLNLQASTMVARGFMTQNELAGVTNGNGYLNCAQDLRVVSTKLNSNFDTIKQKMDAEKLVFPLSSTELERGLDLSYKLLEVVSRREQSPETIAENNDLRSRAFTLFAESYNEIRSGVIYVRRKIGDADEIAPSLYGTRKAKVAQDLPADTAPQVSAPVIPVVEPRTVPIGARGGSPFRD